MTQTPTNHGQDTGVTDLDGVSLMQAQDANGQSILAAIDGSVLIKGIVAAVLCVVLLVSAIPLANHFSTPESYEGTISSLEEKKGVVTGLMTLAVGTSAAISAVPDDAGTPIAERLADLSQDFLVILTIIYLEKFLLTTFGLVAFRVLIPLACILAIVAIALMGRFELRTKMGHIAAKLLLLALALVVLFPVSVAISDKMEEMHHVSWDTVVEEAQASVDSGEEAEEGILSQLAEKFTQVKESTLGLVNYMTEKVALLIVTSCVVPILTALLFLWVVKMLLGVKFEAPLRLLQPRLFKRP